QPVDLREGAFLQRLKSCGGDLFVVVAYGRLLPAEVLVLPRAPVINVHSSLLPRYRGAAPINWAILNGDRETGLTIMKVTSCMDAGDILCQEKMKIFDDDTAVTLRARMAQAGPKLLLKTVDAIEEGNYTFTAQDEKAATTAPKLTKELGDIRWDKDAVAIRNLVRGLLPWPGACTRYRGKLLKILDADAVPGDFATRQPGEVAEVNKKGFIVATGQGGLLVKEVHLEASRPMSAFEFITGHKLEAGFIFQ
ncbi:MAG: methionyl-tRNA formyltransferase, partial [Candidatus Omnitrophica bacterium]|nr:methionyl-tRNA formyltransferase [Candidatus Omnitrophota bacterium]